MDSIVHRVAKSWTQLSDFHFTSKGRGNITREFIGKKVTLSRAWEKEMATHSSILSWRLPGTEEPGRLQSMGWQSQTQPNTWHRLYRKCEDDGFWVLGWLILVEPNLPPTDRSGCFQPEWVYLLSRAGPRLGPLCYFPHPTLTPDKKESKIC